MGCSSQVGSDAYLQCAGAQPQYSEADVSTYAHRVGAQGGSGNWVYNYVISCLRINGIVYFKNQPGDCGTATKTGVNITGAVVQTGLNAVPVVGGFLAAVSGLFTGAAHQAAVAREQTTICDVQAKWAVGMGAIIQQLQGNKIGQQDAQTELKQLHDSLVQEVSSVAHPGTDAPNAGTGVRIALDALELFNSEAVIPSLKPTITGILTGVLGGNNPAPGQGTSTLAKGLIVGAGVVGAKVAGVF